MNKDVIFRLVFLPALLLILLSSLAKAVRYDEGDWVGYNDFRYITSIAADQRVVYFGTTGGITRYDTYSDSWLTPLTAANGLPSNYVRAIAMDMQFNELWIVTDRGAGKYNITFESWYNDPGFPEDKIVNDWNPSRFPGLFMPFEYNYINGYVSDPDMQRYQITVGYEDRDYYKMYVGTWGMGAAIIQTEHEQYTPLPYGPYDQNISRVVEIGDELWLGTGYGTSDRAITRFDTRNNDWDYFKSQFVYGLDNTEITCGVNAGDYTWLGTSSGLVRIEGDRHFMTYRSATNLASLEIYSLAEYGGFLYVGTANGLSVLPASGDIPDSVFKLPLPDEYLLRGQDVYDLEVLNGTLYIATDRQAYSYNASAGQFRDLDTPNGDLAYGVYDIFTRGDYIYFGARFGVVAIDLKTDSSFVATENRYSSGWKINQVYADSKFIWAATNIGLWKYRIKDQYTYLYTAADGLPVNEVNSLVADGDYFWLGTSRGLIRFYWNDPGRGD